MSEATVKLNTQAQTAQLREYAAALRNLTGDLKDFSKAADSANAATGGAISGGGAVGGGATVAGAPSTPNIAGVPIAGGAPMPGGGQPAQPGASLGGNGPGFAGITINNATINITGNVVINTGAGGADNGKGGKGGKGGEGGEGGEGGAGSGAGSGSGGGVPSWYSRGRDYLYAKGNEAGRLGLGGSSLFGFVVSSAQTYFELSKILMVVGQRFREAEENAISFGSAMGYTVSEAAGLVEALGNVRDNVGRAEFSRYSGFARVTGLDPGAAIGTLGRMGAIQGNKALSDSFLAQLFGAAGMSGMSQGRLSEFMQTVAGNMESLFSRTGSATPEAALNNAMLPGYFFGYRDPRAQNLGSHLTGGIDQVLTGSTANQTFLMRAMGFGSAGGPGYIEMRRRMEAGVTDPRNLADIFAAFNARGMSRPAMFRALEAMSGGSLRVDEIEALIDKLGTPEGLADYRKQIQGGGAIGDAGDMAGSYLGNDASAASGAEGAWAKKGREKISLGEMRAQQMENMRLEVGQFSAPVMINLTEVVKNLVGVLSNLLENATGGDLKDIGRAIVDISTYIKKLSERLEQYTDPQNPTMTERYLSDDMAEFLVNGGFSGSRTGANIVRNQKKYGFFHPGGKP